MDDPYARLKAISNSHGFEMPHMQLRTCAVHGVLNMYRSYEHQEAIFEKEREVARLQSALKHLKSASKDSKACAKKQQQKIDELRASKAKLQDSIAEQSREMAKLRGTLAVHFWE